MRTAAILSTVVLSASLVAGCGSSDGDKTDGDTYSSGSYCDELKAAAKDFATLDSDTPDFKKFDEAIYTFHELAGIAPSEVSAEWKTLDGALSKLDDALEDAGLSLADLGTIMPGELPEGMSQEDLEALGPKLKAGFAEFSEDDFDNATEAIEKHAKDECDVDLEAG